MIGINYKVGGLVFAPLMEIHRRALGATKSVAVLAAAGAAVAMGGAGALTAGLGIARSGGSSPAGSVGATPIGPSDGGLAAPVGAAGRPRGGGGSPAAAATALSALAGLSGNPIVRGALSTAAQGFRRAETGSRIGPGGLPALAGSSSAGGVFSVSMQEAAQSVLGERAAPGEVGRLAASPDFQHAMRTARRHASGLERAGIPFQDQVRGAGFSDAAGYLSGLSFQVAHRDLRSAVAGMNPKEDGFPSTASPGLRPTAPTGGPLSALASRLDALGEGGFPGAEGAMRDLRSAGWWSFNPDPSDPRFSRYAQTFLEAGRYLSAAGEPGSLAMLERAVQAARGSPAAEPGPRRAHVQDPGADPLRSVR